MMSRMIYARRVICVIYLSIWKVSIGISTENQNGYSEIGRKMICETLVGQESRKGVLEDRASIWWGYKGT